MLYNNPIEFQANKQRERVQLLVQGYAKNPMKYTPSQVDELREMSNTVGVDFPNKQESFDPKRNAKNLIGGFVEGFTTIPTGVQPKTTYEAISHSMGHLAGFAPGILSAPLSLLGKGLRRTGLGRAANVLFRGSDLMGKLNKYSVPMFFGHKAKSLLNKGLHKSKLEAAEFMKKGSAPRGILEEATTLGVASAVSSIWKGPDVIWDSMVHGGVAGGMFGGLGNFRAIGNYLKSNSRMDHKKGEAMLKGAIGAGMLGIPSYLRNDPVEMIMYETLLGGYFGYNARPSHEAEAGKFIKSLGYHGKAQDYVFKPESHPEWNSYSKNVKDHVVKQVDEWAYKYVVPKVMKSSGMSEQQTMDSYYQRAQIMFKKEKPSEAEVNSLIKQDADQHREFSMKGYKMEWEQAPENMTRDFEPEDATENHNVNRVDRETPLDNFRKQNEKEIEVLIPELHIDHATNSPTIRFVRQKGYYEKGNSNMGETTYGSVPVENFENNPTYITIDKIHIGDYKPKHYKSEDKVINKFISPMAVNKNKGATDFQPIIDSSIRRAMAMGLDKQNQYIFGGVKDKGVWKIREIHTDVANYSNRQLMEYLIKGDPSPNALRRVEQSYREGLSLELEWLGLKKQTESLESLLASKKTPDIAYALEQYGKQWRSNVLTEAQTNGYYLQGSKDLNALSKIHNIVKEGHVKHVIDWNKRAQLRFDKSFALKSDAKNEAGEFIFTRELPGGGIEKRNTLNYEILKDSNKFEGSEYWSKGESEVSYYESWTDGIVVVKPKVYDQIQASAMLPNASMLKPVITVKLPDGGILLVKSAAQRLNKGSDAPLLELMNSRNLDMVMFTSAAKHTGNIKPLEFRMNEKNNYEVSERGETLSIPIESVRVNLGTYVDPVKAVKPQIVGVQMSSNITESQYKGGNRIFYEDVMLAGPKAKLNEKGESYDIAIDKYRETGDWNFIKDIKIDNLSVEKIHDILLRDRWSAERTREDVELAKFIRRKLRGMDKEGELDDPADFNAKEWQQYIYRNDRILDTTNFDSVYSSLHPATKDYMLKVYKKYIAMRYMRPKWETSGKVWLNGQLPHNQVNMKVNAGEIKLDLGMRQMKVNITTKDGKSVEGAPSKLGKAWDKYKDNKDLAHNFEFTVVRIPMDSLSGARLLKFTGFTDSRGTSARTHAKDDWYLGGADKDSDSAFIYQGFTERVKDIYRSKQDQWGDGTKEKPMVEKKSKEMDSIFIPESKSIDWTNESFKSPYSQFNPSMRKVVAENAYVGTDIGMGLSAKAKEAALHLWDLMPENYVLMERGKPIGEINKKSDGLYNISRMGMEMMNRSADAADYANSLNIGRYNDVLFKAGWNAKRYDGNPIEWKDVLLIPEYQSIMLSKNMEHKSKDWISGYQYSYKQYINKLEGILEKVDSNVPQDLNVRTIIARQMRRDNLFESIDPVSANYQRYIDSFVEFRKFFNQKPNDQWASIMPHTISNPDMILRNHNNRVKKAEADYKDYLAEAGDNQFKQNKAEKARDKAIAESTATLESNILKDLYDMASMRSLTKQGKSIYKYLKEELGLDTTIKEVQSQLLEPIASYAAITKYRIGNFDTKASSKSANEKTYDKFNLGSRDINSNRVNHLDRMIKDIDIEMAIISTKYKDVHGADAKKLNEMLKDYSDLHMLSSLLIAKRSKDPVKDTVLQVPMEGINIKGTKEPNPERVDWSLGFQNMYYQSKAIGNSAIKKMTDAYSDAYKVITYQGRKEEGLPYPNRKAWESPEMQTTLVVSDPVKKVIESRDPRIEGPTYIKDPTMNIQQKAEALGVRPNDIKAIEEFQINLKKVPRVAENFNDWFTQFTFTHHDAYRDVSTMTIKDVHAFNRWFKDIDRRFIERGKSLPPYAWRADPRYMNEQMALFEGKVFSSFEADVVTSDGIVKRKIKNFTGSMGILKEMFRSTNNQIDKHSALDLAETERLYSFRKQLNKEHAHGVNQLAIAKRIGENYRQNKWYEKLKDEIFIYDGKTRRIEEMVDIVDGIYKKDFQDFGGKWLWSEASPQSRFDVQVGGTNVQAMKHGPTYHPDFFSPLKSNYETIKSMIKQGGQQTFGTKTAAWYGDIPYTYSGVNHKAQAMPIEFQKIAKAIEVQLGYKEGYFNSMLANVFPKGQKLGEHRDAESIFLRDDKSIGKVATVSLGADTNIIIRKGYKGASETIKVGDGSLYVMPGKGWQNKYTHEVGEVRGERVSLTFRHIPQKHLKGKDKLSSSMKDRVNWKDIDIDNKYGIVNDYLRYNSNGSLDINHFLRRIGRGLDKGLDLPQIGLENLLRFQYEYKLEKIISDRSLSGPKAIEYRQKFRSKKDTAFEGVGEITEGYFPRMWENTTKARQAELDAWLAARIKDFRNDPKKQAEVEAILRAEHESVRSETGGTERPNVDAMMDNVNYKTMTDAEISTYLTNIGFFNRPGVVKSRTGHKPGWDRDLNTIDIYKDKIIRSYYKNFQSIFANNRIDTFVREAKFGKFTNDWADYMRFYVRDSFGHQSTFQQRIVDMIEGKAGSKDTLGLGKTFYYKASDHRIIKSIDALDAKFSKWGWKVPGFKNIPKITAKEGTPTYQKEVQARREYLSRLIHNAGKMEAKFNLLTLLANTGTMTANIFGGSTMTISQGGLKNFARSYNNKWLQENVLTDIQGNHILKYKDPLTGKDRPVTNKKELRQWVAEQGIIDKFIADEIGINLSLKTGLKGKNGANFVKELGKILTKNPEASNETILELARRYGVQDTIEKAGGWFMQKSERIARADSFITHALQYKERYGAHGREMRLDDPGVIDAGLRGVEATQFLYHSAFRPAYMRTSLGKVLTRFKLFAFQSVRTRKELYRQAKHYGFEEGTPSFDRFKNLFLIDMFTMALGSAFAYSLFDTALPPPYDWVQETGEWLFGNKEERNRSFFGQWPYPVAPLQVITPPVARIPMAAFSSLINNDWERFADYHIHTMYPFGRIVRQVDQTFDEPYGTTLGRGMQQFFRLPGDKIVSKLNKAELARNEKTMIKNELDELGELI